MTLTRRSFVVATGVLTVIVSLSATWASAAEIVAHRGASHDAPENTIAAFQLAWKKHADGIEGDFLLTSDKQVICLHDKDTKRVANQNLTVSKSTYSQMRNLDVGSWKSAKYRGERIPTLQEVLEIVPAGKYLLIEIKTGPEILPHLSKVLRSSTLKPDQMRIIAFDAEVIAGVRKEFPQLKAHWLTSFKQDKATGEWTPGLDSILKTARRINASGVDVKAENEVVDQDFVDAIHAAGLEFHVWTINDPEKARRYDELGVDSITTDRPQLLREALQKTPR